MAVPFYIINLDRSPQRWQAVQRSAEQHGIEIRRIAAIEGKLATPEQLGHVDEERFRSINGRPTLPGEIGCYLSHLKALQAVADGPDEMAVICEDDVEFLAHTAERAGLLACVRGFDVVKLFNFRYRWFVAHKALSDDVILGRCVHGPLGSAAAYAVTREGARKLLSTLLPMALPYDVALEEGWQCGVEIFTVKRPAIRLQDLPESTIGGYDRIKYPAYKRLGTLIFRAGDYCRRVAYAFSRSRLYRR